MVLRVFPLAPGLLHGEQLVVADHLGPLFDSSFIVEFAGEVSLQPFFRNSDLESG